MLFVIYQILFLVLTYFIAAIPFGLLLAKVFAGVDIRKSGSKNIGATNVARVVGKKIGLATLILDGLKGALMVIIARFSFFESQHLHLFLVLVSLVAVIGHIYPIYLNFKGGKGVATTIATLLALHPLVGFLVLCIWIIVFLIFRISSLSSLFAISSSIILSLIFLAPISQVIFCAIITALIFMRHKENITRLIAREEKRM